MDSIEVVLVEYKALREEVVATMNNRSAILRSGLIAVGTIFAAGGIAGQSGDKNSALSAALLIYAAPCVAICILSIWVGEYCRMQRAGAFLGLLEAKINSMAGEQPLLVWETYLSKNAEHMTDPYAAVVFLLGSISVFSAVAGIFVASAGVDLPGDESTSTWLLVMSGVSVSICSLVYAIRLWGRIKYYRTDKHLVHPKRIGCHKIAVSNDGTYVYTDSIREVLWREKKEEGEGGGQGRDK
jgi:hypothetical protein